jgi:hypothetical protein
MPVGLQRSEGRRRGSVLRCPRHPRQIVVPGASFHRLSALARKEGCMTWLWIWLAVQLPLGIAVGKFLKLRLA